VGISNQEISVRETLAPDGRRVGVLRSLSSPRIGEGIPNSVWGTNLVGDHLVTLRGLILFLSSPPRGETRE